MSNPELWEVNKIHDCIALGISISLERCILLKIGKGDLLIFEQVPFFYED